MIEENPYGKLIDIMRSQGAVNNPAGVTLGVIKSVNPLKIEADGLLLDSSFVTLSNHLKPHKRACTLNGSFNIGFSYKPTCSSASSQSKSLKLNASSTGSGKDHENKPVTITVSTTVSASNHDHGSHTHTVSGFNSVTGSGSFSGSIDFTDYAIKEGDLVVIIKTNDGQKYIVIDKINM